MRVVTAASKLRSGKGRRRVASSRNRRTGIGEAAIRSRTRAGSMSSASTAVKRRHRRWVVGEVEAGAETDLEDLAGDRRERPAALGDDLRGGEHPLHDARKDVLGVPTHRRNIAYG